MTLDPAFGILKSPRNWLLVALVFFCITFVFHRAANGRLNIEA